MFACERKKNTVFVYHAKPHPTFELAHKCLGYSQSANEQTRPIERLNGPNRGRGFEIYANYKIRAKTGIKWKFDITDIVQLDFRRKKKAVAHSCMERD